MNVKKSGVEKRVRMAEMNVGDAPDVLITIGLGSCVGVAIYDYIKKIGGLVHIMLPENRKNSRPAKYADTGIPYLIEEMTSLGARRRNLKAKIAGGARMFNIADDNSSMNIGARNVEAVREVLHTEKIELQGEDVGKDYGRSMRFFTLDGRVVITSHQKEDVTL
ncbi:MAG: chemotaxis protein CheD [Halanaerobiaceae bacterium]